MAPCHRHGNAEGGRLPRTVVVNQSIDAPVSCQSAAYVVLVRGGRDPSWTESELGSPVEFVAPESTVEGPGDKLPVVLHAEQQPSSTH